MATSCAENSVVEVFESSFDELCSSSIDSLSTCTTKNSHCSAASATHNITEPTKLDDLNMTFDDKKGAENETACNRGTRSTRRSSRSVGLRTIVLRSSKSSSQTSGNLRTDDMKSNATSSSFSCSSKTDSQLSDLIKNALQYGVQNNACADKPKDLIVCQWCDCSKEVNFGDLLDHLNNDHVKIQQKKKHGKEKPTYVCKWVGCKVFGKPSTLYNWLERHVVCHLGNKPFRCIVDHCGMRFSSQFMLNRHINGHFPKQKSVRPKKVAVVNGGVQKVKKERKRKTKHCRPCPAASRDFCDSFTMSCIQRYITNFCQRTQVQSNNSGQFITFHGVVIGSRTDFSGTKSCLVRWIPLHVLPDEWLLEHQVPSNLTQVLPLSSVPGDIIKFLMCD